MKKMIAKLLLASVFAFVACTTDSDDGDDFDAAVVCPADGSNKYGMPNRGTFIDERDGQEYKYTTIGDQVWMAQNLNYDAKYSMCYDDDSANCDVYGRLYVLQKEGDRFKGMDLDFTKSICPSGWHVPTFQEWSILIENVGGFDNEFAAMRLKTTQNWEYSYSENGTDVCGFGLIPAGSYWGKYTEKDERAHFWTSTAKYESMNHKISIRKEVYDIFSDSFDSIRCIKD